MEIVSKNKSLVSFPQAVILEKEGEMSKAASMLAKLLKKAPTDLAILSRLMIISRKLKNYDKETMYINKAIKVHELKYDKLKTRNLKVATLSKKLNTLLGHTDGKGKNLLAIPEVEKLEKRKATVLKKMKG